MTKKEYEQKRENIMTSSAPFEIRQKALIDLDLKYQGQFINKNSLVENGEVKGEEL